MNGQATARARAVVGAVLLLVGSMGCLSGRIYSHVTRPLDLNLNRTPVYQTQGKDSTKTVQYYLSVDWGSTGIGDVAKRHGMTRVYYADLETRTVLGFWRQHWVHVYGER